MQALLVCQAVAQQDADREDEQQRKKSRQWKGRKNYRESTWWRQLQDPQLQVPGSSQAKIFRRRFTVP